MSSSTSSTVNVRVLYFARVREVLGRNEEIITLNEGSTVASYMTGTLGRHLNMDS